MEQLGDFVFRCIACGYKVDERQDPALHHRVLISKPSIYHIGRKYIIKEGQTRTQYFRNIRKGFDISTRYDKDSMYNPNNEPQPGRSNRGGLWMNLQYCNMALDAKSEDELNKMLKPRK